MSVSQIPFRELREANIRRLPRFTNSRGEPAHSQPDGSDWTPLQWWMAAASELGELGNVIKKSWRRDMSHAELQKALSEEWEDVVIYLDILAFQVGVSDRVGCGDIKL